MHRFICMWPLPFYQLLLMPLCTSQKFKQKRHKWNNLNLQTFQQFFPWQMNHSRWIQWKLSEFLFYDHSTCTHRTPQKKRETSSLASTIYQLLATFIVSSAIFHHDDNKCLPNVKSHIIGAQHDLIIFPIRVLT